MSRFRAFASMPATSGALSLSALGVAIALAVAFTVFMLLRRASKSRPGTLPHESGHVGVSNPPDTRTGARIEPQRRGVEQSGSSSGS